MSDDARLRTRLLRRLVYDPSGCLLWTGSQTSTGYGQINVNGHPEKVHRVSYRLYVGPIPEGELVRHTCDTPLCGAPTHLAAGTVADNADDMVVRGRSLVGSRQPNAKLTEADVIAMLDAMAGGTSASTLAGRYGVSEGAVLMIRGGFQWRHVARPEGLPRVKSRPRPRGRT